MRYELTKELETGNATIDREHRELFNAVNQLLDLQKIWHVKKQITFPNC